MRVWGMAGHSRPPFLQMQESRPADMSSNPAKIIVVETGRGLADKVRSLGAQGRGYDVVAENGLDRVLERFESESFDVLLLTSQAALAAAGNGVELLEVLSAKSPRTQVLFLAEPGHLRAARAALRSGACQYARLPIGDEELRLLIETALERQPLYGENRLLHGAAGPDRFAGMVGRSAPMREAYRQIRQAAATDVPVLLQGETGTGKDLAAEAVHRHSARSEKPYIPVNLGAVPSELVASELFGYERGAFTGADRVQEGKFELGNGGTVFLDEIGAIDERVQISLLRLIEHKRFHRLGGKRWIRSDVRIVAATNQDLRLDVERGAFREDLLYRLDVFRIVLPPLRERREDIPLLLDAFLQRYSRAFQKDIRGFSPECARLLETFAWPGNVRELKNVVQRAALVCAGDKVLPKHLPPRFRPEGAAKRRVSFRVGASLEEVEREMILRTLEHTGNNRKRTAEILGISRRSLYNRLNRYGIE